MKAEQIVDIFLEDVPGPFAKKAVTLEYRPYKSGEDWKWFWVLHPEDGQRALAHGEAESRAAASTQARLRARQLKSVITQVKVAAYASKLAEAGLDDLDDPEANIRRATPYIERRVQITTPPPNCVSCGGETEWADPGTGLVDCHFCGASFNVPLRGKE